MLYKLSEKLGIKTGYWGLEGQWHQVSEKTITSILSSLSIKINSEEDIKNELTKIEEKEKKLIQKTVFSQFDEKTITIPLNLINIANHNQELTYKISSNTDNTNITVGKQTIADLTVTKEEENKKIANLVINKPLSIGYYNLSITLENKTYNSILVIHPQKAFLQKWVKEGKKVWGVATQLYSLKSDNNQAFGDFTDLENLGKIIKDQGGDIVGINPLHALPVYDSYRYSPYSPFNRKFLNFLYIDITKLSNFKSSKKLQRTFNSSILKNKINNLKETKKIHYTKVHKIKLELLRESFKVFKQAGDKRSDLKDFKEYCKKGGTDLLNYATFCALECHFKNSSWQEWKEEYHNTENKVVQEFIKQNEKEIEFYMYLQWQAFLQIDTCHKNLKKLGFTNGIYGDLAIGAEINGSESWENKKSIVPNVSIGAPPDKFAPQGQNWHLGPLNPINLQNTGYLDFRKILSTTMNYCDILRIDHILGLSRLFFIPEETNEGLYVTYNFDEMLKILTLESHLHKCMIVGEALGNTEPKVLNKLQQYNILSYQVFRFNVWEQSKLFKRPQEYPTLSMSCATTHDLPTIAGFYIGRDLYMQRKLSLYNNEEEMLEREKNRSTERKHLLSALEDQGLKVSKKLKNEQFLNTLSVNIQAYIAKTPSAITIVNLEDILGETKQINIPGTSTEYGNWQKKLSVNLEELPHNNNFKQLKTIMKEEKRVIK